MPEFPLSRFHITYNSQGEPDFSGMTILIVDDDEMYRERLGRAMENRGLKTLIAADYAQAVHVLSRLTPELAAIDLNMPGKDGLELLKKIRELSPQTKTVVVTGYGSIASTVEAMRLGAVNYVTKPADADDILSGFTGEVKHTVGEYKPQTLAESEWDHIHRVLTECNDNISEAARRLGIPRRTLQRKLKKRAP